MPLSTLQWYMELYSRRRQNLDRITDRIIGRIIGSDHGSDHRIGSWIGSRMNAPIIFKNFKKTTMEELYAAENP